MWNRKELKEKAKNAFKANYWKTVAVSILYLIVCGGSGLFNLKSGDSGSTDVSAWFNGLSQEEIIAIVLAVVGGIAAAGIISIIIKIFLLNPLEVGCQKFFKENAGFPAEFAELGAGFKKNYANVVLTILLRDVFLVLWTLLFIIPGVIKLYSYRMVPFIVAENPEIGATEAITKSREMMKGQKWDAFVLDLSFLGWIILSVLTAGILGIFYVYPYMFETNAELYLTLKEN